MIEKNAKFQFHDPAVTAIRRVKIAAHQPFSATDHH
jgi:hypothetical protein